MHSAEHSCTVKHAVPAPSFKHPRSLRHGSSLPSLNGAHRLQRRCDNVRRQPESCGCSAAQPCQLRSQGIVPARPRDSRQGPGLARAHLVQGFHQRPQLPAMDRSNSKRTPKSWLTLQHQSMVLLSEKRQNHTTAAVPSRCTGPAYDPLLRAAMSNQQLACPCKTRLVFASGDRHKAAARFTGRAPTNQIHLEQGRNLAKTEEEWEAFI